MIMLDKLGNWLWSVKQLQQYNSMLYYQYRDSHVKDKTVLWPSYL